MVTVIITTHNRRKLLECAVKSVFGQTYKKYKLIIVNDNSTDDTSDYLKTLNDMGNVEIIEIDKEHSKGGNYARNLGISKAMGKYVAFLDDDDEWFPKKLEKQVSMLENYKQYGMVYCGRIEELQGKRRRVGFSKGKMDGDLSLECFTKTICTTSSMLIRIDLLKRIGLFDENLNYWQDFELNIRIANETLIGYINEPLFLYRVNYSDKLRLTNKYQGWWEAIHYIENKHLSLMEKLPDDIKKYWNIMIYKDAASRCKRCKLLKEQRKNRYHVWKYSNSIIDLIRLIVNA